MKINIKLDGNVALMPNNILLGVGRAIDNAMENLEKYNPEVASIIRDSKTEAFVTNLSLDLAFKLEGNEENSVLTATHDGVEEVLKYEVTLDNDLNIVDIDNNDDVQGKESAFSKAERIIAQGAEGISFEPIQSYYDGLIDYSPIMNVAVGDMDIAVYRKYRDDNVVVKFFNDCDLIQEFECSLKEAEDLIKYYSID